MTAVLTARGRIRCLGWADQDSPRGKHAGISLADDQAMVPPEENVDGPGGKKVAAMVASNDLDGFKRSAEALYEYDMSSDLGLIKPKTMLVSGAADGMVPEGLRAAAKKLEDGKDHGGFAQVQLAGHLPMVENCLEFVKVVNNFLA